MNQECDGASYMIPTFHVTLRGRLGKPPPKTNRKSRSLWAGSIMICSLLAVSCAKAAASTRNPMPALAVKCGPWYSFQRAILLGALSISSSISPASMVSTSEAEGDAAPAGGVGVCCELELALGVVPVGCCELACCGCWISVDITVAGVVSCPRQECPAGKPAKVLSNRKSDLSITLISPSPDESVGPE